LVRNLYTPQISNLMEYSHVEQDDGRAHEKESSH